MDFRATLKIGLEEKIAQDKERENDSNFKPIANKPKQKQQPQRQNTNQGQAQYKPKQQQNKQTVTSSTSANTSTSSSESSSSGNKNKERGNNSRNNRGGNRNNFGTKGEKVIYEGIYKFAILSRSAKYHQILHTLAQFGGPELFSLISSTCQTLENFARDNSQRYLYGRFPCFQQVNFKVLIDVKEKVNDQSVPATISASSTQKQNSILNYWKDNLVAGETGEGFNRSLIPEFVGGVAIGVEGKESFFVKSTDLHSVQSFLDAIIKLINNVDAKQTVNCNGTTVALKRLGLGGEKVHITVDKTSYVVSFEQFSLNAFISIEAFVNLAHKFVDRQKSIKPRQDKVELVEKQKEILTLLDQRFKVESLQQNVSTLKKLLKAEIIPGTDAVYNYFKGQDRKNKGGDSNKKKGQQVTNSLVLELMQNDESIKEAEEQVKKMQKEAVEAKNAAIKAKEEADEESKKNKKAHKEALSRERESKTIVLRKRVPGQVEQPKLTFTLPPPETPEQAKAAKEELKKIRADEVKQQQIQAEEKARKAEEKRLRKEEKKLNKEKEKLNTKGKQQQQQQQQKQKQVVEEPKYVPKPVVVKEKTPEDIANEKREKMLEARAEESRLKKKQVQLARIAAELEKKEKKAISAANEPPKPVKEKKISPAITKKIGGNKPLVATKSQTSTNTIIIGASALMAVILLFLWFN